MGEQAIDQRVFRRTLSHYASGITVVTGQVDGEPAGFTCQSFYSVSIEPPLVSLCVLLTSTSWPKIRNTGRFCINVLAADQQPISDKFAKTGTDKWSGVTWSPTAAGNPIIDGTLIWLDCTLHEEIVAGDHLIVLGRVQTMSAIEGVEERLPLLFYKGRYHHLSA